MIIFVHVWDMTWRIYGSMVLCGLVAWGSAHIMAAVVWLGDWLYMFFYSETSGCV